MTMKSQGVVRFFVREKYGFICPDDGAADIYFNIGELRRCRLEFLDEGDRVAFDVKPRNGRPEAVGIELIERAAAQGHRGLARSGIWRNW